MIPEFLESGLLPPGVHSAENWTEFVQRFGWNDHRKHLLEGLGFAIKELRGANCESLFIDGSFVTEKDYPSDYDACYETSGINFGRMNKVFADFSNQRALQKAFFRGEFLIPPKGLGPRILPLGQPNWAYFPTNHRHALGYREGGLNSEFF